MADDTTLYYGDVAEKLRLPQIDRSRLKAYRIGRIREQMKRFDLSVCVMLSPISLRYAVDYRNYALFMSHIPCTYLFISLEGPFLLHNALDPSLDDRNKRAGRAISHFYAGDSLPEEAKKFAKDIDDYLIEIGSQNRKVGLEYANPSLTQALMRRDIEVIDGVLVSENARRIKNEDEIACIRYAMSVAEHGANEIKKALVPGVSELQLWALLNYTNIANDGDWHDGRMLASGPRTNPWLQEASDRRVESGDLLAFDTDMIGPMGYFADLSRTFHCGPANPTSRQKLLYRLAYEEVQHNLSLVKAGVRFSELQQNSFPVPEEFQAQAYPCIFHGVGMSDEYPHLPASFQNKPLYDDTLEAGMVICAESYMGAVGDREGVKLEQQVLVTRDGYEPITQYPFDESLM